LCYVDSAATELAAVNDTVVLIRDDELDASESGDTDLEDNEDFNEISVPLTVVLSVIGGYIVLGTVLFGFWEGWDTDVAAYYCFITISTIGFGDVVPSLVKPEDQYKLMYVCTYMLFGMATLSMCFTLVQDQMAAKFKMLGQKCGLLSRFKRSKKDDNDDDEDDGEGAAARPARPLPRTVSPGRSTPSTARPVQNNATSVPRHVKPATRNARYARSVPNTTKTAPKSVKPQTAVQVPSTATSARRVPKTVKPAPRNVKPAISVLRSAGPIPGPPSPVLGHARPARPVPVQPATSAPAAGTEVFERRRQKRVERLKFRFEQLSGKARNRRRQRSSSSSTTSVDSARIHSDSVFEEDVAMTTTSGDPQPSTSHVITINGTAHPVRGAGLTASELAQLRQQVAARGTGRRRDNEGPPTSSTYDIQRRPLPNIAEERL